MSRTATGKYGIGFLRTSSSLIGINWGRIHSNWKTGACQTVLSQRIPADMFLSEDILSTNKHSYALNSGVDVQLDAFARKP